MAQDVTKIVEGLGSRVLFLGITFEQLVLLLQGSALVIAVTFWLYDIRRRKFAVQVPSGCVKLGLKGASHAADEFDRKYDTGTKDTSKWRVKALFIHPIKSCGAIELDEAEVNPEGMSYDRLFAFAEWLPALKANEDGERPHHWQFRTLRQPGYDKLALVKPEVWAPKQDSKKTNLLRVEQEGRLIVRFPNKPVGFLAPLDRLMIKWGLVPKQSFFQLPLIPREGHKYPMEHVTVWLDDVKWINMGEHIPNDFREWLGAKNPVTIFRADPHSYRKVQGNAPKEADLGWQPRVAFPDSYPLHMMNIASVHDVSREVGSEIPSLSFRRFRPNIALEGPPAYDEDDWKRCRIGGNEVHCSCRTLRCKLPNVDPDTAVRHGSEPDKTLRRFRIIDPGSEKSAALGLQAVPTTGKTFQIRVGDAVEVVERGHHHFVKF